jgi:exopolysaccharide biosynthesis operon protein EpsL
MGLRQIFFAGAAVVVPLLGSSAARADAGDTFNLSAGYSVQTDSNLYRLSSADTQKGANADLAKPERIDTSTLTMTLDKSYSLQRFQLTGSFIDYRYQTYDYLSFNTFNYSGAWLWSATPWLKGTLSTGRQRALNSYADFQGSSERNIRTLDFTHFDAESNLGAAWRLLTAFDHASRTNDLPVVQEGDDRIRSLSLGLRYIYPSGSTFSFRSRTSTGDYLNRTQTIQSSLPSHYDEREQELRMLWLFSGKTTMEGRLSYISRTHPALSVRNYSGPVGDLTVTWVPTGKLRVLATVGRDLAAYQSDTSSVAATNRFSLTPVWQTTAHTSLRASYQRAGIDYSGALAGQAPTVERHDDQEAIQIGLDWKPRPTVSLSLSLQSSKRLSNTSGFDYKTHGATLAGQITY